MTSDVLDIAPIAGAKLVHASGRGVLVLHNDRDDALVAAVERTFPGARHVTCGVDVPNDVGGALRALRRERADAVVVAQNQRKLKVLALAIPTAQRFLVRDGLLEPFGAADLAVQQALLTPVLGPAVLSTSRRIRHRVARLQDQWARPPGLGLDNDFSTLARRVASLPLEWPRLEVSVVLPVYNRKPILAKTIAALRRQTYPLDRIEVIIADDGSHDHPDTLVAEHRDAFRVRVVRQEDLGFRAARVRNLGIQAARGELVVLLDCDMMPAPELIAAHARWFHTTELPLVTIGGRRFVKTDHLTAEDILADPGVVDRLPDRLAPFAIRLEDDPTLDWRVPHYDRTRDLRRDPFGYRYAASGNLAFRRRDAIAAGLFDESYQRWGGEDVEFAYRLYRRGAWFIAERDAIAHHQEHADAVVREEDALTTRRMTRSKIPVRRREAPGEEFEVAKVAIVIPGTDVPAETIASANAQVGVSTNVIVAPTVAEGIDRTREEYVLELLPGDRLYPDAAVRLVGELSRQQRASLAVAAIELPSGESRESTAASRPRLYRVRDWYRVGHLLDGEEDIGRALARLGRLVVVPQVLSAIADDEARVRVALSNSVAFRPRPESRWAPLWRALGG